MANAGQIITGAGTIDDQPEPTSRRCARVLLVPMLNAVARPYRQPADPAGQ